MSSRREFVGMSAAALLVGCGRQKAVRVAAPVATAGGSEAFEGRDSLKAHAAAHGFLYGCAVDVRLLKRDEGYARLVREQSNIVVAENAMKWGPIRPSIDEFNFEQADELVAFAEANRIKVRGHNLCWHRQLPGWFEAEANASNARGLLTAHIQRVAGRYAGRMHSWDVVNEAVEVRDGRSDGLRDSPWLKLVGEEYIEVAFKAARNADPQALLTYNDYGIEGEGQDASAKRAAVLTLLRRLKARHVPLDAVGVQAHIEAGKTYGAGLREFMAAAREMGLQVFITEMDVNDRALPGDVESRDKAVAETYGGFLNLTIAEPAVRVVLTWGITDGRTWLNSEDARSDKLPERCLPFGADDLPKSAFFAMRNAFDLRKV